MISIETLTQDSWLVMDSSTHEDELLKLSLTRGENHTCDIEVEFSWVRDLLPEPDPEFSLQFAAAIAKYSDGTDTHYQSLTEAQLDSMVGEWEQYVGDRNSHDN